MNSLVEISGHSMYPTFKDGDVVLADLDAYCQTPPQPDDIVLALHPYFQDTLTVKRVRCRTENGRFFLVGDNRIESSDSRSYGPLPLSQIKGKILGKP